jgi:hypothetical protein
MDDKQKIDEENEKEKHKFHPDDSSQSEYSSSVVSIVSVGSHSASKKKYQRPTYDRYKRRFGKLHADEWKLYSEWKKRDAPKEDTGTIRDLLPPEIRYFEFAKKYYQRPAMRPKAHFCLRIHQCHGSSANPF